VIKLTYIFIAHNTEIFPRRMDMVTINSLIWWWFVFMEKREVWKSSSP